MQPYCRPHFYFKPTDHKAEDFAQKLSEGVGSFDQNDCDIIVTIPGDGSVYHAFHHAVNKPVFAVKPPKSNSILFSGHEHIENGIQLVQAIADAEKQAVHPLKTDVYMSDGSMTKLFSYVDINIRSDNAQATLIQEHINDIPTTKKPVMGSGWIIATALGSTALNETRHGKVLPINSPSIVRTMNGVSNYYERQKLADENLISMVVGDNSTFEISVATNQEKRATKIDFDSWSILPDGQFQETSAAVCYDTSDRHIEKVVVRLDKSPERARILLLNKKYRTPNPFY